MVLFNWKMKQGKKKDSPLTTVKDWKNREETEIFSKRKSIGPKTIIKNKTKREFKK